ncbi:MAG TPA: hypothetical protein V6C58_14960, partial [Allocoleopsis sp.]
PCQSFRSIVIDTLTKLHDGSKFTVGVGSGEIPDSDYASFQPSLLITNSKNAKNKYGATIIFKDEDKNVMPFIPLIEEDLSDNRYACDIVFVCTGSEPQDMLVDIMSKSEKHKFKCFGMNPSISESYCGSFFNEAKLFTNSKHVILQTINVPAMLFATYLGCKPYVYSKETFDAFITSVGNGDYSHSYPIPTREEITAKHTNFDRAAEFLKKNGAIELSKTVIARKSK